MFCPSFDIGKFVSDGKRHVIADIRSSDVPATMPTTGEGIKGLGDNDVLDPGTTLYIINSAKVYMMNEEHEFKEQ